MSAAQRAIEAVFRIESPRLIAALTRLTRDVGRAEELAQDALVAALERWPSEGVPENPAAWLMQAAKHRAVDTLRRGSLAERKHEQLARDARDEEGRAPDLERQLDEDVGDDLLRLVLIACHPILSTEARVALTLRLLGGLSTTEISRAFLTPEATIQQRIVRAKKTLADARVPFEVPKGEELTGRLESVLEVIYLVFNEGYSATAGDDWMRPGLCEDALRLGRVLAELVPGEPEVHGLVALMELQASRSRARLGPGGEPVCSPIRTARGGTSCSSAAASPRSTAPSGSGRRRARTCCRRASRPATRVRRPSERPTGRASSASTGRWGSLGPRR